eukprot:Pgem_evm1s18614
MIQNNYGRTISMEAISEKTVQPTPIVIYYAPVENVNWKELKTQTNGSIDVEVTGT